jgi:hypothetical protein
MAKPLDSSCALARQRAACDSRSHNASPWRYVPILTLRDGSNTAATVAESCVGLLADYLQH